MLLMLGFLLNAVYVFRIVPLGKNETYLLEAKYSNQKPQTFINTDSSEYITLAINLKNGKGFVYPFENPHLTAMRMPGFPLYLSLVFSLFGIKISVALLFQCLLLTGVFGICYILTRMMFSDTIALISLAVMILWPNLKFYGCAYLGSETLASLMFYVFLLCILKGDNALYEWRWLAAGVIFLGGAIYTRPEFLLFIPFLGFWLIRHYRTNWRSLLFMLMIIIVMLAPWTIRNFYIFNKFIPASTVAGVTLEGSYNTKTVRDNPGGWDSPGDISEGMSVDKEDAKYEVYLNELRTQRAFKYLKQLNISGQVRLIFWKLFRLWFPAQRLIRTESNTINLKKALTELGSILQEPVYLSNILMTLVFFPIYLLFWIGLIKSFNNFRKNELLIYFFLYINLIAILFWGSLRYRFVFEPFIIVFGCAILLDYIRKRRG